MRVAGVLGLLLIIVLCAFEANHYDSAQPAKYIKVDSSIYVKFRGEPKRYFYQTPLGDVTIFEYKPEPEAADSNCLYSVAIYKPPMGEPGTQTLPTTAADLLFNSLITSEETGLYSIGGKILSKNEFTDDNRSGIRYKVLFTGLTEMNQIEGLKDVVYNVKYLKYKGAVIKMWVYTALNKENKALEDFFSNLKFNM